jgi:hypothetical protein
VSLVCGQLSLCSPYSSYSPYLPIHHRYLEEWGRKHLDLNTRGMVQELQVAAEEQLGLKSLLTDKGRPGAGAAESEQGPLWRDSSRSSSSAALMGGDGRDGGEDGEGSPPPPLPEPLLRELRMLLGGAVALVEVEVQDGGRVQVALDVISGPGVARNNSNQLLGCNMFKQRLLRGALGVYHVPLTAEALSSPGRRSGEGRAQLLVRSIERAVEGIEVHIQAPAPSS